MSRVDRGMLVGTEDGLMKLEVESENAMTDGGNLGPTYELKGDDGKRTILFDSKDSRVRKWTNAYTVSGSIDLGGAGGGGAVSSITPSLTIKTNTSVSDENPKDTK
ncbi:MAG: hypothetical protein MUF18_15965 [Fimbriiglobus sp.]|jgi:hypothetical protein|nr:hypothetical protein [Fimbriiglobus sp.]